MMSAINEKNIKIKQLNPRAKWVFFWPTMMLLLVPIVHIGVLMHIDPEYEASIFLSLLLAGIMGFPIFGIPSAIFARLKYKHYTYHLDDDAFRKDYGIIHKQSTTIPYDRIQNINISRSLLHRLYGVSKLSIHTAGGSGHTIVSRGSLPGLSKEEAVRMQSELLVRSRAARKRSPDGL